MSPHAISTGPEPWDGGEALLKCSAAHALIMNFARYLSR
jgi:hypothetical protein